MTRLEVRVLIVFAVLSLAAGLTWALGPYALVALGVALGAAVFFFDIRE